MRDQEGRKFIGSFESFSITKRNAGILWLGAEFQKEKVSQIYDEEGGFTVVREPFGRTYVLYGEQLTGLNKELNLKIEQNHASSLSTLRSIQEELSERK